MPEPVKSRLNGAPLNEVSRLDIPAAPRGVQYFPTREEASSDFTVPFSVSVDISGMVQSASSQIIYTDGITAMSSLSPGLMAHRRDQIQEFVTRYHLVGKKVLDVGCGDGHILDILTSLGVDAYGIEPSQKSAEIAQTAGRNVAHGFMTKAFHHPDGPFDGFTSFHVIEHVPDLSDFIQGIRQNLTSEGAGLMEAPSFEQAVELQRFYDFFPDHINYFSLRSLGLVMQNNGFILDEARRMWHGEHDVVFVRSFVAPSLEGFQAGFNQLKSTLQELLRDKKNEGARVVIWGASCHAITMLANMPDLPVEGIIDSAPYKQGRVLPASHIPVFPPSKIQELGASVVIVFAPRYEAEILDQLIASEFGGQVYSVRGKDIDLIKDTFN